MSQTSAPAGGRLMIPSAWLAVRIAAGVAFVVVPFGYAITGNHTDVLMGAGCGLAVGVGVGLRGGSPSGPWTGILIGSMVGVFTALIAGGLDWDGWGFLVPATLALAVGLIDGLGGSSLSGYRDMSRETFIVSVLLALGLIPTAILALHLVAALIPLVFVPWTALVAGLLSHRREGWRDARPPRLLLLGAATLPALMVLVLAFANLEETRGLSGTARIPVIATTMAILVVVPVAAFLLGRTAITWLRPRLRVYGRLAEYLRVMWVPIGGFAVGYVAIIGVFAGFYGMLERFSPGAFDGAGTGVTDWMAFAFFNALGQDYTPIIPVSDSARALVGAHLILSVGWALVLFAAVMSFIRPKLDQIARIDAEDAG